MQMHVVLKCSGERIAVGCFTMGCLQHCQPARADCRRTPRHQGSCQIPMSADNITIPPVWLGSGAVPLKKPA